jgi:galacturan 1,4-alpha-galacturonidase
MVLSPVQSFLAAWRAACAAGNATLLFPKGSFTVDAIEFAGHCGNGGAPVVVVDGVLQPGGSRLSGDAWITFSGVSNLLVTGAGTPDTQGDQSGKEWKSKPATLLLERTTNSTVRGLSFVNSRGFHLNFRHSSRVAAESLHIEAPADSSNTDGIHVAHSNHVRILHSVIGTGDDCVSVGPGSTDVVVHGVVCGPGHGISVGSLGKDEDDVRGLVVRNCTVRGTTNGVRIKTWPGSPPSRASNITFEDITMADVANPVIIDQRYCPHDHCNAHRPSLVQISDVTFRQITGTSKTKVAVQLLCSSMRPCTGVRLVDISLSCGNQPCSTEIVNMQGMPPMPAARLEEEVDVAPGPEQSS